MDVSVNARLKNGLLRQGGFSVGKTMTDNCAVLASQPETVAGGGFLLPQTTPATVPYCHMETNLMGQTQAKFLGTYLLPKIDVNLAATFQSVPGPLISANYTALNAQIQPSLGRPLSGGAANATINLISPGTIRRARQPARLAHLEGVQGSQRRRVSANLDIYNMFNVSTVILRTPRTRCGARRSASSTAACSRSAASSTSSAVRRAAAALALLSPPRPLLARRTSRSNSWTSRPGRHPPEHRRRTSQDYIIDEVGGAPWFDYDTTATSTSSSSTVPPGRFEGRRRSAGRAYRNDGNGKSPTSRPAAASRAAAGAWASAADYDNDGFDVYVTSAVGGNALYRNAGNGTFTDVTRQAGVADAGGARAARSATTTAMDVISRRALRGVRRADDREAGRRRVPLHDGGRLVRSEGAQGEADVLFHHGGGYLQTSRAPPASRTRVHYGFGVLFTDLDEDGWPDIFVANDTTPNFLFHNNHNGTFSETGSFRRRAERRRARAVGMAPTRPTTTATAPWRRRHALLARLHDALREQRAWVFHRRELRVGRGRRRRQVSRLGRRVRGL